MGQYATTTSIALLLPGYLREDSTSTDKKGRDMFAAHITRAEGLVNGYLVQKYSLPFTTVPPMVRQLTEDITCYFALRGALTGDGKTANPYMLEFKTALETLKDLVDGDLALTLTDGSALPVAASNRFLSSTENYNRNFGMDDAPDWRRDPNEVEDQRAERQ